jgi:hypothetical protein
MTKPSYQEVYKLLYTIVVAEKIKIKEPELKELYEQSNGDIRFIINTLQFGLRKGNKNIQSSNIFDTTGKLLSMDETIDSKYDTYWLANDLHSLLIQENYVNNIMGINDPIKGLENLAYSAHALSDTDLFDTYVNMANWEIDPYVALSTINSTSKCNKKTMIKFPQFLGRVSSMNKNKRDKINYDDIKFFDTTNTTVKKEINISTSEKVSGEKKSRGRPKKVIEQVEPPKVPLAEPIPPSVPLAEPPAEPAKPKRGRPRKNPAPVEPIVKKAKGRPKKFKAQLNIEIPASKYLKQGYVKKELSEMDKINQTENSQSILERAQKTGFQIRDMSKENPEFMKKISYGTFIKYITTLNQFRVGGILRSVDDQLRYFTLYNPKLKSSWSVQIKNVKYLMFKSRKNVEEEADD